MCGSPPRSQVHGVSISTLLCFRWLVQYSIQPLDKVLSDFYSGIVAPVTVPGILTCHRLWYGLWPQVGIGWEILLNTWYFNQIVLQSLIIPIKILYFNKIFHQLQYCEAELNLLWFQ